METGGYQVMLDTSTHLTGPDLAEEADKHSAEEWGMSEPIRKYSSAYRFRAAWGIDKSLEGANI